MGVDYKFIVDGDFEMLFSLISESDGDFLTEMDYVASSIQINEKVKLWEKQATLFFLKAVRAGLGKHSIEKGPVGLLTRPSVYKREATETEMVRDFYRYGTNIAKEYREASREQKKKPFISKGKKRYYAGAQRTEKIHFPISVFHGQIGDISRLVKEVDGLLDDRKVNDSLDGGPLAKRMVYSAYHATDGVISRASFKDSNSLPIGLVKTGKLDLTEKKFITVDGKAKDISIYL